VPELPDVTVYVERLEALLTGKTLNGVRLKSPFLLRSVDPPLDAVKGRAVTGVRRVGKRLVFSFEGDLHLVLHLMIAGRLRWSKPGAGLPGKMGLAAFDFDDGALVLTEAGTKKRAALHVVAGKAGLSDFDRGGLEVFEADGAAFAERLRSENHTLKRSLTDPRLFSGIGNAYSDEILHRARLSPFKQTRHIDDDEIARLHAAVREVLSEWTGRIREQTGDDPLPKKVTAFREGMAVHGKYDQPCPDCGAPVQRILYAENECNYCARCQTGGRVLADRVLSQLMKDDWPRTLEELEEMKGPNPPAAP
jgi:formamidopyrimidine-DNA glycosylase